MRHEQLDEAPVTAALDRIYAAELSGVVRETHYSLVIIGPHRIPLVEFMKAQAAESLMHAQQAGEILTEIGGQPSTTSAGIAPTEDRTIQSILQESLDHELNAVSLYRDLLEVVADKSVFLEEFARGLISQEEEHQLELRKMLRDYS